jgi:hypothetical protein
MSCHHMDRTGWTDFSGTWVMANGETWEVLVVSLRLSLRVFFHSFFHRLPEGWPHRNSFHSPVWDRMKQHGVTSSSETFSLWLDDLDGLNGGYPHFGHLRMYRISFVWCLVGGDWNIRILWGY